MPDSVATETARDRRYWGIIVALVVFVTGFLGISQAGANEDGPLPLPLAVPDAGLVYDGLQATEQSSVCEGEFLVATIDAGDLCSHGPDAAPPGVDISSRTLPPLELGDGPTAGIECHGDGTSGPRVHAIYVVAADAEDRFDVVRPYIEQWAARVETIFDTSAANHGGTRHVRWVTDANCGLVVDHVVVSASGDNSFGATVNELANMGYDSPDRKYLMWVDANVYCGIGQMYTDDSPGADNINNGAIAMFGRVDAGCWGQQDSVAAHELVHMLGGVQFTAPNTSGNGHCTDENDRLCYVDGEGVTLTYPCGGAWEGLLDCGGDDYYNPNPAPGSYLATHWNTANNKFLTDAEAGAADPPEGAMTSVEVIDGRAVVRGWALMPGWADPTRIQIRVNGTSVKKNFASLPSNQVPAQHAGLGPNHGFVATVPVPVGTNKVCAFALDSFTGGPSSRIGCRTVTMVDTRPIGAVDGIYKTVNGVSVKGWTLDRNYAAPIEVAVKVDGKVRKVVTADTTYPGLSTFFPWYGNNHGFDFRVYVPPGKHMVCVVARNSTPGGGNKNLACQSKQF
jgi:hypothetical protein